MRRTMNVIADHRRWRHCIVAVCLLAWAGCGRSDVRLPVEGTVTLDETPLAEGSIAFRPLPGTSSPTAGGTITNGQFSLRPDQGPREGKFRVEITSPHKAGQEMDARIHAMIDVYEETIPTRYNQNSELTADVTTKGPNRFVFALKTH
jgi:hypothetical protein